MKKGAIGWRYVVGGVIFLVVLVVVILGGVNLYGQESKFFEWFPGFEKEIKTIDGIELLRYEIKNGISAVQYNDGLDYVDFENRGEIKLGEHELNYKNVKKGFLYYWTIGEREEFDYYNSYFEIKDSKNVLDKIDIILKPRTNLILEGENVLIKEEWKLSASENYFFRYVGEWEWSYVGIGYKKVRDFGNDCEYNGKEIEEIVCKLIQEINGLNEKEGIDLLTKKVSEDGVGLNKLSERKIGLSGNLRYLNYLVGLDETLYYSENDRSLNSIVFENAEEIKLINAAIKWRDSVLNHPFGIPVGLEDIGDPINVQTTNRVFTCVLKQGDNMLVADLSKEVDEKHDCSKVNE